SLGFIAFCSGNGTAFFVGVTKGGSGGWTIGPGGDGAISSSGAGGSKGIRSIGGALSIDGSGKMPIFGGSGSGVCVIAGAGAASTTGSRGAGGPARLLSKLGRRAS